VQFHQPRRHHHQISHHLIAVNQVEQSRDGGGYFGRRIHNQVLAGRLGRFAPMPGVLKGGNLRFAVGAAFGFEKHVVIAAAVEGRVEVNQVNAVIGKVFRVAQDVQIVAIIQTILEVWLGHQL